MQVVRQSRIRPMSPLRKGSKRSFKVPVDTYGRIDVLVNNAGLMAIAPLSDARTDEWDRMIDINIKGLLYGVAAALPVFQKQNSGHFINIASVAGLKVFSPVGTVYSGTKFAVRAISEGLRHEVGGSIRTTTIEPGAVDSEFGIGQLPPTERRFRGGLLQACNFRSIRRSGYRLRN